MLFCATVSDCAITDAFKQKEYDSMCALNLLLRDLGGTVSQFDNTLFFLGDSIASEYLQD